MQEISVLQLKKLMTNQNGQWLLLDVREPWEFEFAHIESSILMPMNTVSGSLEKIDSNKSIYCLCHHGARSFQVADFLQTHGYADVYNVIGGIDAWSVEIDNSIARY